MSETQGSVIRQFNIYDTSASPPLQRIHEIGAKAENVLIERGEGQDPVSVQDALLGSTAISLGLKNITTSDQILLSDKEHNTISANSNYNLDTLKKANSIEFTLQNYRDSSNKVKPIGCVHVTRGKEGSIDINTFSTSLKDLNCNIVINGVRYPIDNNNRIRTIRSITYTQISLEIKEESQDQYYLLKNNKIVYTDSVNQNENFSGNLFNIYYKDALSEEKRSGKDTSFLDLIYPIGSIYITTNDIPPCLLFGGKWEKKQECFLLGSSERYAKWFNTQTGGSETVALTTDQTPLTPHTHNVTEYWISTTLNKKLSNIKDTGNGTKVLNNSTSITETTGSASRTTTNATNTSANNTGAAHNNMPPFLAVNIWERTA